jgi:cytochrome c553
LAKRDRSSSVLFAALCAVVGCTAIIDGAPESSQVAAPTAHGSQSGLDGAGATVSSGGDGSAEQGGLAGMSDDAVAAGVAGLATAKGNGGAPATDNAAAGAGGHVESGGRSNGGAEQADGGEATAGQPPLGGAGSGAAAGTSSGGTSSDVITWKGPLPVGNPARGHLLVIADKCGSCHAQDLGGRGFYRNITPDLETGIGSWTDRQIANAIRGGGGPGTQFCSVMPLYSGLKDQQVADMVAYLRSVAAISNKIVSICPGHYPPENR